MVTSRSEPLAFPPRASGGAAAQTAAEPSKGARLLRRVTLFLLGFSAVSAIYGGAMLVVLRHGSPMLPPLTLLQYTPFESYLWPGLVLAFGVGGASLAAWWLLLRRASLAVDVQVLAGGILFSWIVAEVAMMREWYWLHGLYGGLGLVLLTLGAGPALSHRAAPRLRWTALVTGGEFLGFCVPTLCGVYLAHSAAGDADNSVPAALALVAAGGVEGLVLGASQAAALPRPLAGTVARGRFALLTGLGAATAWCLALIMRALVSPEQLWLSIPLGVLAACAGLLAMGTAQWLELRRHATRARAWIGWTALAWLCALPATAAPSPFVDYDTPALYVVALYAVAGLWMAYVMALITWRGVLSLQSEPRH